MSTTVIDRSTGSAVQKQADLLFHKHQLSVYQRTDRLFAALLLFEWIALIVVSLVASPSTWAGQYSQIHVHVWMAIFFGAIIIVYPIFLVASQPGTALTRHVIAVSQMLFSSLLIHFSGGRIETHFHIFGSLAFLATYRDWRVLVSASLVVAVDHFLGGLYWPQYTFGISSIDPWRWLEHTGWVIFEDIFLAKACLQSLNEMKTMALRQAEVEATRESVELKVKERTAELRASEAKLSTQYAVTRALAESESLELVASEILTRISSLFQVDNDTVYGAMWRKSDVGTELDCVDQILINSGNSQIPIDKLHAWGQKLLPDEIWTGHQLMPVELESRLQVEGIEFCSGFLLPIVVGVQTLAVVQILTEKICRLSPEQVTMLQSLAEQIAQFKVRKRAEEKNRQLAAIVQYSSDAIFGHGLDGIITSWNRGAEKLFGYQADEIIGQSVSVLIPVERISEWSELESRLGNSVEDLETLRARKDGTEIDVSVTYSPVSNQAGQVIAISCIARDITQRKEAEKRVSEFYSCVSHELRTPLTSIKGALGLIEGNVVKADSAKAKHLITVARTCCDRLIRLINDILDLKKIEAGKMELIPEDVDAIELVSDALTNLYGMACESGIKLVQEIHTSAVICADRDLLMRIMTNLVSNAIKFSSDGSTVRVKLERGKEGFVRISVIDQGIGIPADQMHKLFGKFQQLDSSDTRKLGGTGLGLAISKALIQQQGGEIGVTSSLHEGSVFWFEIPCRSEQRDLPILSELIIGESQSFQPQAKRDKILVASTCKSRE